MMISCTKTMFNLTCLLIISTFLTNHANAFPQARRRSISSPGRGVSARLPTQVGLSSDCDDNINTTPSDSNRQTNRRHLLQTSMYSLGLALAATSAHPERGNAVEFGLPNILLSADDNKAVKGMPAPIKKSSGLGYKIRAVSKVMVSQSSIIVSYISLTSI